ncbi:MAG: ATP-binding cassette domain-containing protein [Spirochaetes bacterium]|nr:ATP-binding cassette domain-containing protein [Spirochaetota bacterium]
MIEVKNLHVSFSNNHVLRGLDIRIDEQMATVVIGRSGIGKSVLLRSLCGLIKPEQGSILIDGEDITMCSRKKLLKIRNKIGMLFQEGALFDSLSVYENVAFPLTYHHLFSREEIDRKVRTYLDFVEMQEFLDAMPSELSGGMKRKVAIARAMIMEPKYLLYDEPTNGLDPYSSAIVEIMIKKLQQELNITSLIVTHDIELTHFIADRIALLERGIIVSLDSRKDAFREDSLIYEHFIKKRERIQQANGY